ncbi:hypothetical protein ES707_14225 [subsurface metagenome]
MKFPNYLINSYREYHRSIHHKFSNTDKTLNIADILYDHHLMPCCGNPIKINAGPRGGMFTNIECRHCGQKFNMCPQTHYLEKI